MHDAILHELLYSHLTPAAEAHMRQRARVALAALHQFRSGQLDGYRLDPNAAYVRLATVGARHQPETPCVVCGAQPYRVIGNRVLCAACCESEGA